MKILLATGVQYKNLHYECMWDFFPHTCQALELKNTVLHKLSSERKSD